MAGHASRGWTIYAPSNTAQFGTSIQIKCDLVTTTNNGSGYSLTPVPGVPFWPGHRADLRCAYGVDLTNPRYKDSCIATNNVGPLYILGATFADNEGNNYTVNGLRSERFRVRNLK